MSDRNVKGQEQETRQAVPSAMRGRPGPVHEALYSQLMDDVRAMIEEYAPTTGTVTGMDGGKVLVQVDEESSPREVGIPRERGRKYEVGDRVRLQRTRGSGKDQYTALGSVSTKDGKDPAVDSDQMYDGAVTDKHIKKGAVTRDAIGSGAVGTNEVEEKSLPLSKLNQNAQNTIDGKAEKSHGHNISEISGANFASASHKHPSSDITGLNFASSSHGHGISDITKLEARLTTIESDITKLKNKGGGGGGGGGGSG